VLNKEQIDDAIKVRILGLHLMNVVGPDVLTAAVETLRNQMKAAAGQPLIALASPPEYTYRLVRLSGRNLPRRPQHGRANHFALPRSGKAGRRRHGCRLQGRRP
jgi:hypothetical protein